MFLLCSALALAGPGDTRFDLELQEADLHSTIRMLAELGDLDVIVPDSVYGRVTVRLHDVTWETALGAVLSVEGLDVVTTDGAVWITRPR